MQVSPCGFLLLEKSLTYKTAVENLSRPKADPNDTSQVGAPMAGVVVELRVHVGSQVKKGDPVAVLSAMKMVRKSP